MSKQTFHVLTIVHDQGAHNLYFLSQSEAEAEALRAFHRQYDVENPQDFTEFDDLAMEEYAEEQGNPPFWHLDQFTVESREIVK